MTTTLARPASTPGTQPDASLAHLGPFAVLAGGTAVVAAIALALPQPALGWRIAAVVVVFHVAMLTMAARLHLPGWRRAWLVLAPMSVVMVLPDWFLSAELGTLQFTASGAPMLGSVPVFMAGMWVMALFPLVVLGSVVEQRSGPRAAGAAVALGGLVFFWTAEALAPLVPLWQPVDVTLLGPVAAYVLLPEVVLSVGAWLLVRGAAARPVRWTAAGVLALPWLYLGLLATGFQVLG
jgi:hypothetical protein